MRLRANISRPSAKLVIIAYDTPCNRRRRKLARLLDDFGVRVQKSVFEAHLDATQIRWLVRHIEELVEPDVDLVYLISACATCRAEVVRIGGHPDGTVPDYYIA